MKKKKLKKIAKLIHNEVRNYDKMCRPVKEGVKYVKFDKDVSEKVESLILNLIQYKDNINIQTSETQFSISTMDITKIKTKLQRNSVYTDDNYFEIVVNKGEGFSMNYGYGKRSHYQDKNMYADLIKVIEMRVIDINRENFEEIWSDVLTDSGLIRENNLKNLFDE